jgi:alpha-mannosidase
MDWAKKETFYEKLLINFAFPRKTKLMYKIMTNILKSKLLDSSVSINYKKRNDDKPSITVVSIGNSHLDSAWLWRKEDTREKKIEATFSRNVHHLSSGKFPSYSFTANAVQHYEWIRDDYPDLFNEIKKYITDGRWDVVGGDWIEMDVNLSDGESLIRQRLIGQRFNLKEFQKLAETAWYDDVFGWSHSLPQILVKTGCVNFYTNKFCYSDYSVQFDENSLDYAGKEKFPFFHFNWRSKDQSSVLVTWAQHKNNFHKHLKNFLKHSRTVKKDITNKFDSTMTWQKINAALSDEIVPYITNVYGAGDGGMGPRPLEILEQEVWEQEGYVRNATIGEFMSFLKPYVDRLPIWEDELYLEGHRGTLTSVGMIKENNHTAEILLNQAESLSVFAGLLGADHFQDEYYGIWKLILFLQFHDVLPGSSIAEVYRDAAKDYNSAFSHLSSSQENALANIASILKSEIKNNYITVYNPCGWPRNGYLTIYGRNYNNILDHNNSPLIIQKVAFSSYVSNREIQLGMDSVPGTEYLRTNDEKTNMTDYENLPKDKLLVYLPKNISIGPYGIQNLIPLTGAPKDEKFTQKIMENETDYIYTSNQFYIKISKSTGRISHLSKTASSKNILKKTGIGYKFFKDERTNFDAWNLDPDFRKKPVQIPPVEEIIVEENGPLRHTLLIKHTPTAQNSRFHTRLSFYHNMPYIFGETLINWQEEWKILKLSVDMDFDNQDVYCGNQFGFQKRSTKPKTVYQKAKYEYAYQQYAFWKHSAHDPNSFGSVAFYSQSKYGMSGKDGNCEFTFLKAPQFEKPDLKYATLDDDFETRSKFVDHGFHRIPWAIELFTTEPSITDVTKQAYNYNKPFLTVPTGLDHKPISFISLDSPNVLIHTVKEIESYMRDAPDWFYNPGMADLAFIVRCVEYEGTETKCKINFNDNLTLKKAIEVDMLERISNNGIMNSDINLTENNLEFTIQPYEIKSIMVIGKIPLEEG